jgi:hypothetical protein
MIVTTAMVVLSVLGVITVFHESLGALFFPEAGTSVESGTPATPVPAPPAAAAGRAPPR